MLLESSTLSTLRGEMIATAAKKQTAYFSDIAIDMDHMRVCDDTFVWAVRPTGTYFFSGNHLPADGSLPLQLNWGDDHDIYVGNTKTGDLKRVHDQTEYEQAAPWRSGMSFRKIKMSVQDWANNFSYRFFNDSNVAYHQAELGYYTDSISKLLQEFNDELVHYCKENGTLLSSYEEKDVAHTEIFANIQRHNSMSDVVRFSLKDLALLVIFDITDPIDRIKAIQLAIRGIKMEEVSYGRGPEAWQVWAGATAEKEVSCDSPSL